MTETIIKKIAFVTYLVKDLKASRNFYESLFNLKAGKHSSEYVEYDLPEGGCFTLSENCFLVRPSTNILPFFNNVCFEVNNIHNLVSKLKEHKINFASEEIMEFSKCYMSCIFDLDGNKITLHQLK